MGGSGRILWIVVAALAATPFSCDPPNPPVRITPNDGERAETAVAVGLVAAGPNLVSIFNDNAGAIPPGQFLPDIEHTSDGDLWRRGGSRLGYATRPPGGAWTYRGKIFPPDPWAFLVADGTIARDPNNPAVLYAANMAISGDAWFARHGDSTQVAVLPPPDGICVARSIDGGNTFPDMACYKVQPDDRVDMTAIAVDGSGRVWVATVDMLAGVALHRSSAANWRSFAKVAIQCDPQTTEFCASPNLPASFVGDSEPRLVTTSADTVVLASVDVGMTPALLFVEFDPATGLAIGWDHFDSRCAVSDLLPGSNNPATVIGKQQPADQQPIFIRNQFRYSFDVGVDSEGLRVLRTAYEFQNAQSERHFRVVEIPPVGDCKKPQYWSTDELSTDPGQHWKTSVDYENRGQAGVDDKQWWVSYLTTENQEPGTVQVVARTIGDVAIDLEGFPPVVPALHNETPLSNMNWTVCNRITPNNYWGDYFGIAQYLENGEWKVFSTFSDSRGASPCGFRNLFVAQPLQVAVQTW